MSNRRDSTPIAVFVPVHGGDPVALTEADIDRFWLKVDQSGGPDACWPWRGYRQSDGYGKFQVGQRSLLAHRVAFVLSGRNIPPDLCVLHACDWPPCCNPKCLWDGTREDNNHDCDAKGRRTKLLGQDHWSRQKPDRLARGERHGSRTHPERVPRGTRHGSHLHPERWARGEAGGLAKLTEEQVLAIRAEYAADRTTFGALARKYRVNRSTVARIVHRVTWVHI